MKISSLPRSLRSPVSVALKALTILCLSATFSLAGSVWERWETNLTSSSTFSNPYKDVTVNVTFTQGTTSFSSYAFWDGNNTWRIRTAFPATGTWTWSSTATPADAGLTRSGSVTVSAYAGTNTLYQKGFLKVASDGTHLEYNNGTPFLWIGDTAWRGPMAASLADWKTYLNDRQAKKFTVIQVSPYTLWNDNTGANTAGQLAWTDHHAKINPAFWQTFDEYANCVNDRGMVLVMVGLPGWQDYIGGTTDADLLRTKFAQYLTGRYGAHFAIYSVSSDSYINSNADKAGEAFGVATSRQLITMHPTGPIGVSPVPVTNSIAEFYYAKSYVDFAMNQSAHHSGNSTNAAIAARLWNLSLEDNTPKKPLINAEAFYHGDPNSTGTKAYKGTARDVRSLGWISWTSGSLGYTYGSLGLWDWGLNAGDVTGWTSTYWQTGMNRDSSTHMKYMAEFFATIDWWTLKSSHSSIQNQPANELIKMTFAHNTAGTLGVAYLPGNASIQLNMAGFSGTVNAQWFNPVAGTYSSADSGVANSGSHTFTAPSTGSEDWVLLLKTGGTSPALNAPSELNATAVATNQINLSWTDNSGNETGFRVESKTGTGVFGLLTNLSANATSYSHLNLAAGSTYTYRVQAFNATTNSAWSAERSATTPTGGATSNTVYECELLSRTASDSVVTYTDTSASGGKWDHLAANAIGDYVEYTVNVASEETYTVKYRYKKATARGICQLQVDGTDQGATVNQSGSGWVETDLGSRSLTAGTHTFRFQVTAANGTSYALSCDSLTLVGGGVVTMTPPSITTQPQSQTVAAGSNVSFTVAATGTAPLSYQWKKNGTNIGTNGTVLVLQSVTTNQAGEYSVVITNNAGSVTSSIATLTVNEVSGGEDILAEAENLTKTSSDKVSTYADTFASDGKWDYLGANAIGDYVEYTVNVPAAGTYTVKYIYKKATARGVCQLQIDGTDQGSTVNQSGSGWVEADLGSKTLTAGNHTFRFQVTAANDTSYALSVDCIKLIAN
jgi:hypothetical protein